MKSSVPQEMLDKEKEIFSAQAVPVANRRTSSKKWSVAVSANSSSEITLLGQPFVKDPEQTVGKLLKAAGARSAGF